MVTESTEYVTIRVARDITVIELGAAASSIRAVLTLDSEGARIDRKVPKTRLKRGAADPGIMGIALDVAPFDPPIGAGTTRQHTYSDQNDD